MEKRPDHARALGLLMAEWALAEDRLEQCLAFLLYVDADVATAIYQHFTSTGGKIELLVRLNNLLTSHEADKKSINEFLERATQLNAMRNAYVHAMWAVNDDHPNEIQRVRQSLPKATAKKSEHEKEWMTAQKILDDVNMIATWTYDFFDLLFRIDRQRLNKPRRTS